MFCKPEILKGSRITEIIIETPVNYKIHEKPINDTFEILLISIKIICH